MKNRKTLAVLIGAVLLACAATSRSVRADSFSVRDDDSHHNRRRRHYLRHEEIDAALTQLSEARRHLDRAGYELGGHRALAIRAVDAAIAECRRAIDYASSHESDAGGDVASGESVEERIRREGNIWTESDGPITTGSYVEDTVEGRRNQPEGRGRIGKVLSIDRRSHRAMVDFGRDYVVGIRLDDLTPISLRPAKNRPTESAPSGSPDAAPPDSPPSEAPSIPSDQR
jgi:hypothetical protein